MTTTTQKISDLEKGLMEMVYQSRLTDMKIDRLSDGINNLKDGVEDFIAGTDKFKDKVEDFIAGTDKFKDKVEDFIAGTDKFKDKVEDFIAGTDKFKDKVEDFIAGTDKFGDRVEGFMTKFGNRVDEFAKKVDDFVAEIRQSKKDMDKKWGELSNKMGTLVEDIFVPSFDLAIEKYFNRIPKDVMPRRKMRMNGASMELDILAYADDKAFVVEVKSSPNRSGNVNDFLETLHKLPLFLPEIEKYQIVPIYAALNMDQATIDLLTKNNIFAMIVRGDILEIPNFESVSKRSVSTC